VAKKKHIARLNRWVDAWNEWRCAKQVMQPELSYANLEGANLSFADSESANLSFAKLESARHANLRDAALVHAAMSLHGVAFLGVSTPRALQAQGEQRRSYFSTFSGTFPVDKLSIKWHDGRWITPAPF
jgi:hypothetical protein